MVELWSSGAATGVTTIKFSHVDPRTISRVGIEVRPLALTRERSLESRETLRIFADSSVRPSNMTRGLGIAHTLALMCDLSWSAIAVLPMSYRRRLQRWAIPASPG